ncbi:MAG: hypothetical protein MIO90_00650 [Methanomassiliicoccales archaeon]|nr:hypothetical protein [Methanomassiliicoccales archaeon]
MVDDIVLKVAKRRMLEIGTELPSPDINTHFSIDEDGSGRIDLFHRCDLIGQEIIETTNRFLEEEGQAFRLPRCAQ